MRAGTILVGIALTLALVSCGARGAPVDDAPSSPADGNVFYVATDGDDGNPGTLAQPWRTIQHAAETASPGDTVYVRGGVYHEAVTVQVSGAEGAPITFASAPGETAILDGSGLTDPDGPVGFHLADRSHLVIQGFEIRHFTSDDPDAVPAGIFVSGASHHVTLQGNHIHHIETQAQDGNAHGIAIYGDQAPASIHHLFIQGNELDHLKLGWSESLVLNGNVEQFQVLDNFVHNNDNIGIDLIGFEGTAPDPAYDRARDGLVQGNTVTNIDSGSNPAYQGERSADGIYVDGGTRITIQGNRVSRCNIGIEVASEHANGDASFVTVRNNLVTWSHVTGLAMGGYDRRRGSAFQNAIVNNTFFQNDTLQDGNGELLLQHDVHDNVIENNIFYANAQSLLISNPFSANQDNQVDYNLYFAPAGAAESEWQWQKQTHQGFDAYQAATGNDSHSRFADPRFVDITGPDLHLQADSPAIDAGDNSAPVGDVDLEGNPRVQNGQVDLGALEFPAGQALYLPLVSRGN